MIKIERVWEKTFCTSLMTSQLFFDDVTTILWLRHNVLNNSVKSLVRRLTKYFQWPTYFFEAFVSFSKIQRMFFCRSKVERQMVDPFKWEPESGKNHYYYNQDIYLN